MIAEAVLKSFNDLEIVFGGAKQVTVSVGVASVIACKDQHEEFLVHEADKALYRAKQAGRNRVVHADCVRRSAGGGVTRGFGRPLCGVRIAIQITQRR